MIRESSSEIQIGGNLSNLREPEEVSFHKKGEHKGCGPLTNKGSKGCSVRE